MSKYWLDYVKSCYDLVVESEKSTAINLAHDTEAYIVHLLAKNFERVDIGVKPVAILILQAASSLNEQQFINIADECLLIHSYPLKRQRWPSESYYEDIGTTAYGLANHFMEHNFKVASIVLSAIFKNNRS
jgi:hypothetical protein